MNLDLLSETKEDAKRAREMERHEAMFWLAEAFSRRVHRFAKTMPGIPHFYCVRGNAGEMRKSEDYELTEMVETLRKHAYQHWWRGRRFPSVALNGYRHWVGSPVTPSAKEFGINRRRFQYDIVYDEIAEEWDRRTGTAAHAEENELAFGQAAITPDDYPVLDVGCGTGLVLDHVDIPPDSYVGIDPSVWMCAELRRKHPRHETVVTKYQHYYPVDKKFGLVLGMFGGGAYLRERDLLKLPMLLRPGGRWILMTMSHKRTDERHSAFGVTEELVDNEALLEKWADKRVDLPRGHILFEGSV